MTKRTRPTPRLKLLWMTRSNRRWRHSAITDPDIPAAVCISDHEDILVEILARLPVKSLMRFRCVSPRWRALISDPHFVKKHTRRQLDRAVTDDDLRFLFSMRPPMSLGLHSLKSLNEEQNHVATREIDFPVSSNVDDGVIAVGSCNGLICTIVKNKGYVIWNPCTGSSNVLPQPSVRCVGGYYGFGYDSVSDDYKVVHGWNWEPSNDGSGDIVAPMTQVFSLKNGLWKTYPDLLNADHINIVGQGNLLDGVLHWLVKVGESVDGIRGYPLLGIEPFSLADEKFKEVISVSIPHYNIGFDGLLVHRNRLCLRDKGWYGWVRIYMMKDGNKGYWSKVLTVRLSDDVTSKPLRILENGDFLAYNAGEDGRFLALYEKKDRAFKCVIRPYCLNGFEPIIYRETLVSPVAV